MHIQHLRIRIMDLRYILTGKSGRGIVVNLLAQRAAAPTASLNSSF
jgi:hypothetical protein